MAVIKLDMENDSDNISRSRYYYRPSQEDFSSILIRLKAQRIRSGTSEFSYSPTCLDEGNETKQEKQERLRQEALQRDQYILSVRPNRHIVFAAKFAKIKNQGLTKRYENQVHVWNQEMERNFRLAGASEKALEKELKRVQKKEEPLRMPRLRASYPSEKLKNCNKFHAMRGNVKLPRLRRSKDLSNARRGSLKRNEDDTEGKSEFSNTSLRLPPIETAQTQKNTE